MHALYFSLSTWYINMYQSVCKRAQNQTRQFRTIRCFVDKNHMNLLCIAQYRRRPKLLIIFAFYNIVAYVLVLERRVQNKIYKNILNLQSNISWLYRNCVISMLVKCLKLGPLNLIVNMLITRSRRNFFYEKKSVDLKE